MLKCIGLGLFLQLIATEHVVLTTFHTVILTLVCSSTSGMVARCNNILLLHIYVVMVVRSIAIYALVLGHVLFQQVMSTFLIM